MDQFLDHHNQFDLSVLPAFIDGLRYFDSRIDDGNTALILSLIKEA
ncbi:hypothetical protein [Acinetobacter sp. YH12239]|nr:hypothetical protein [Acinetobacter sp. YH12239]